MLVSLDEFDEDVAKLQAAIHAWRPGDEGMPIDQAVDLMRRKEVRELHFCCRPNVFRLLLTNGGEAVRILRIVRA